MKRETLLFLFVAATAAASADVPAGDPYVEFTGTQSVDTGYRVTKDTAVVADFQMTDVTTPQQCVWSAGDNLGHRLYVASDQNWSWGCHDNYANGFFNTGKPVDRDRVVATVDGFGTVVSLTKGGAVWWERRTAWQNPIPGGVTSTYTLKIGSRFADNKFYASMKLYSFKIYEAGVLKRDYVPATRDGIVGLLDKIEGGFVYDARLPADASHNLASGGDTEKALEEAFNQYEEDTKLKDQVREDLERLRKSYRAYLEYYVPIYKKYMQEYDALCVEKDRAYLDLYGGRADDALLHTSNILAKYPNNGEAMLLHSMGLIIESASEAEPRPTITMNDIETQQPNPDNENKEERPQLPMTVKQRQANDLLQDYTKLYPDRTAPALVLEGLLYQQLGDQNTAMLRFHQASAEYPRQAERLTDMLDAYNMRTYLCKTQEGQYLRRLYASTMEGYGLFSPNLLKAHYHASQGDMEESRKEIFNHFFRRGNQGIYDELLSDMQFCEENLYGPFKSLLLEQSYLDVSVEPKKKMLFWTKDKELNVTISNRSDLKLENVRVYLCIHYTDMYKDEYDVVKVPKTQNIIGPRSTVDLETVELNYRDKGYKDITRIRAIAITDDRICWIDEVGYKNAKALAPYRSDQNNLNQRQQQAREEYLNNYSLEPQKLQATLRDGVNVLPPEEDPCIEKSWWKTFTGWFSSPDNTLNIELPRALVMADPVFSLRPLDADDALQPEENYLAGTAIHLKFDYEPECGEALPLYIYTEAADFKVDIEYHGKDSAVQAVTILRQ